MLRHAEKSFLVTASPGRVIQGAGEALRCWELRGPAAEPGTPDPDR